MSYVAISGQFRSEVRQKINAMKAADYRTIERSSYKLDGTTRQFIDGIWKEHAHLYNVIPMEWKGTLEHVSIQLHVGEGSAKIDVTLDPPAQTPPNFNHYRHVQIVVTDTTPEVVKLIAQYEADQEIETRWKLVLEQVMGFLDKCKSLNEAYKLWPQIEMYIPSIYMANMREKREKAAKSTAAADALKDMDVDSLTAAAVIARIGQTTTHGE